MSKKKEVGIVIPYFGQFPNYFDFWLKSALANKDFDFLIFTDNKAYQTVNNVKFINMSFEHFKKLLQNKVNFSICLNEPYKICDYRPLFGEALHEYLKSYSFWGFCDVDLILGNLSQYITAEILSDYDKIYEKGHLTLLRNVEKCNILWKVKHHIPDAYRYDEAFKTPYPCHFDEDDGLTKIAKLKKIKTYACVDFADIDRSKFNFFMLGKEKKVHPGIFEWNKGQLCYMYKENEAIITQEVVYAHFQKRKIKILNKNKKLCINKFVIEPNQIVTEYNLNKILTRQHIVDNYNYYKINRQNEIIKKIGQHAIQQRIYRLCFKKINRKRLDLHRENINGE